MNKPEINIPSTFRVERIKGRKYYCCTKQVSISGIPFQCAYRIRSDHLRQDKFNHVCIGPDIRHSISNIIKIVNSDNLTKNLYIAISKLDMSIRAATSKIFMNLLESFFKLGQANPTKDFKSVMPRLSRKTFTKNFIATSDAIYQININAFSKMKYCTLLLDAGKINKIEYLIVIIANTQLKPMICENHRFFNGKRESYRDIMEKHIIDLSSQGIQITSIVGDNLPTQKSALHHDSMISMQAFSTDNKINSVIFCSCMCH